MQSVLRYCLVVVSLFALLGYGAPLASAQGTTTPIAPPITLPPPPPAGPIIKKGFSDYINGVPTKYTFSDGRVIDLTIPEDTFAEGATTFTVNPKIPKAFDDVTVTVQNFSTKLEEDRIIWELDGKIIKDEIGGDTINLRMGAIGVAQVLQVTIDSLSLGKRLVKEQRFSPADVAILWEANTYIPPFYKGKPLPSYRSTIKLVPFPTVLSGKKLVSSDNLIYTWSRGGIIQKSLSGYAKRSSTIEAGTGVQEERLTLSVRDPLTDAATERTVTIGVVSPKMLLYAGSPLLGPRYESALGRTFVLSDQETTVRGEPYFFSNEEIDSGLSPVEWKQNGVAIPSKGGMVLLRQPEGSGGASTLQASIQNTKRILQHASQTLRIEYQKK